MNTKHTCIHSKSFSTRLLRFHYFHETRDFIRRIFFLFKWNTINNKGTTRSRGISVLFSRDRRTLYEPTVSFNFDLTQKKKNFQYPFRTRRTQRFGSNRVRHSRPVCKLGQVQTCQYTDPTLPLPFPPPPCRGVELSATPTTTLHLQLDHPKDFTRSQQQPCIREKFNFFLAY